MAINRAGQEWPEGETVVLGNRFEFVQQHDGYVDYQTVLGGLAEDQLTEDERIRWADEKVRRVTFVLPEHRAYLTMRDYSEEYVSWDDAMLMIQLD